MLLTRSQFFCQKLAAGTRATFDASSNVVINVDVVKVVAGVVVVVNIVNS